MDAKELWGKHVVAIRKQFNLSQEELANRIGTNQATISRWERYLSKPTYRLQKAITSRFGDPPNPTVDRETVSTIAESLVNNIRGCGAVIFDRSLICVAKSANSMHTIGTSIIDTHPEWEQKYVREVVRFLDEVDFWDTPWATFQCVHKSQPRQDLPAYLQRHLVTSIVICGEVFCLAHDKTDQVELIALVENELNVKD